MKIIDIEYEVYINKKKPMALEWPILKIIKNKKVFKNLDLFNVLEERFLIKNSRDIMGQLLRNLIECGYIVVKGEERIEEINNLELSKKGEKYLVEGIEKELTLEERLKANLFCIGDYKKNKNEFLSQNKEATIRIEKIENIEEKMCVVILEKDEILIILNGCLDENMKIAYNKKLRFNEIGELYNKLEERKKYSEIYKTILKKLNEE